MFSSLGYLFRGTGETGFVINVFLLKVVKGEI